MHVKSSHRIVLLLPLLTLWMRGARGSVAVSMI